MASMSDVLPEIIISSDAGNPSTSIFVNDLKTGSEICVFKGGNCVPKSLSLIRDDFVISALNDKTIKVWTLSRHVREDVVMNWRGKVSALAVSNCGMYCIAAVEKVIHVWEVITGNLIGLLQSHIKNITCLKFTSDGSIFLSGAEDGMVTVWVLSEVIPTSESCDNVKPLYTWMHHSSVVTDIYIGNLGIYSRVATASIDMTCKIYELESGALLTTICLDDPLSCVTMDNSEYFLMLGSENGRIVKINMFPYNDEMIHSEPESRNEFIGHKKTITCLSISFMGTTLVSGSEDCTCKVWNTINYTCIRTIQYNGSVTNAFIVLRTPSLMSDEKVLPRLTISTFKKDFKSAENELYVSTKIVPRNLSLMHAGSPDVYFNKEALTCTEEALQSLHNKNVSLKDLAKINVQLYSFALSNAFDQFGNNDVDSD